MRYNRDYFIARYGPDGTLEWARRQGGVSVSALEDGSALVAGGFAGELVFDNCAGDALKLTSAGGADVFVVKYEADGSALWASRAGGSAGDYASRLAVSADGSFVLVGSFEGTTVIGPGEAQETALVSRGGTDGFMARFDPNGNLVWGRSVGGAYDDYAEKLALLPDGTVLVLGDFSGEAVLGEGESNQTVLVTDEPGEEGNDTVFVARYGSDGFLLWAKQSSGGPRENGAGISASGSDSFTVVGGFQGLLLLGGNEENETEYASSGLADIFIAEFTL